MNKAARINVQNLHHHLHPLLLMTVLPSDHLESGGMNSTGAICLWHLLLAPRLIIFRKLLIQSTYRIHVFVLNAPYHRENLTQYIYTRYSLTRTSITTDSSLFFDRDILEYCWRLSDKNLPPSNLKTIDSAKIIPEAQTLYTKPETSVSMKMLSSLKSSASFDKQILEYCWKLSDHSSLSNMQEDSDNTSVSIKFTSAAKSVSEASVLSLDGIQDHDSGQIVVRCSKARMAQALYSTQS